MKSTTEEDFSKVNQINNSNTVNRIAKLFERNQTKPFEIKSITEENISNNVYLG